jgi:hypothetical protein
MRIDIIRQVVRQNERQRKGSRGTFFKTVTAGDRYAHRRQREFSGTIYLSYWTEATGGVFLPFGLGIGEFGVDFGFGP